VGNEGIRLTKADVEHLLSAIDTEMIFEAVATALRSLLAIDPDHDATAVFASAAEQGGWSAERLAAVLARNDDTLTALAIELRVLQRGQHMREEGH
jgi:hypothetical protein